ncbi:DUF3828 domain-containing protein [Xenorhabdus sp. 12]|uniref:DUF3828 domain-containing protein n=1 Tax=Xenorhabdus santafensis TaxID=2582833 RepID=A0ABU4S8G1_9GAMM|nr:DUF3828 domain-containing protein [Xenorhabdus sp. 12]MDX7987060.1 DUF3828 domain-containing protein [Xenorhabdus sp. 12]
MRPLSLLSFFLYFMAFIFMCASINAFAKTEYPSPEKITNDFYTWYMQQYLSMEHLSTSDELNELRKYVSEELVGRLKVVDDCNSEGEIGECAVEGVHATSDYFIKSQDAPDEWADVTVETVNKTDHFAELVVVLGRGTEYEIRLPVFLEKQSGQWKIILVSRYQSQSARQVAEAFYTWYMKELYANKNPDSSDYQDMIRKYVSLKLINQLDKTEDKDDLMRKSYFIQGQDYFDDWKYTDIKTIHEGDSRATMKAYIAGLQEKPYELSIELEKELSQWKIVSVSSLTLDYPATSYGHIVNKPIILNEYGDSTYLTKTKNESSPLNLIFNDGTNEEKVDSYGVNGGEPEIKGFFFMKIAGMRNAIVIVSWKHNHNALKINGESYEVHAYYYKDGYLKQNYDIYNDPNLSGLDGIFNDESHVFTHKSVAAVMEYINKKYNKKHNKM